MTTPTGAGQGGQVSDTPRSDAAKFTLLWDWMDRAYKVSIPNFERGEVVPAETAEQLERELAAAQAEVAAILTKDRIKTEELNRVTTDYRKMEAEVARLRAAINRGSERC